MFLRLGTIGAVFSVITAAHAAGDDLTLPDVPSAPQTAQNVALDEPIRQIADTPAGCAVLDKDFPGLRQHAMYDFFKSMTLNQIAALSKGRITQGMLMQAQTDLVALNSTAAQTADAPAGAAPAVTPIAATTAAASTP